MISVTELRTLRKKANLTQVQLAELLGVSRSAIYDWERGAYFPEGKNLLNLARALNVTTSYLMGETDNPSPIKIAENIPTRPAFESNATILPYKVIEIPILSISACMGKGFDNESECVEIIDKVYLTADRVGGVLAPEEPFGVFAEGISMLPVIDDGERVIVNPNIAPSRGDVCLARMRVNGFLRDAVKFYYPRIGGGCILKSSETSGIPPIEYTKEEMIENDVVIVGRVVYIDTGRKV